MKEWFDDIKSKHDEKVKREDAEQQIRKERLERIQNRIDKMENTQGIHIPHPVQKHRLKKEQKSLQNDIAAYEEKKKVPKYAAIYGALMLVLFGMVIVLGESEKEADIIKNEVPAVETSSQVQQETAAPEEMTDNDVLTEEEENAGGLILDETVLDGPTQDEETLNTPAEDTIKPEIEGCTNITIHDVEMLVSNEDARMESGAYILGNDEKITFTILADAPNVERKDFEITYDETILAVNVELLETGEEQTKFSAVVTGKKAGFSELAVATTYDVKRSNDKEANSLRFNIHKLDAKEGKIVYITPTGKKYHNSKACAGKNAIKTTCYDAEGSGFTPCKKCG